MKNKLILLVGALTLQGALAKTQNCTYIGQRNRMLIQIPQQHLDELEKWKDEHPMEMSEPGYKNLDTCQLYHRVIKNNANYLTYYNIPVSEVTSVEHIDGINLKDLEEGNYIISDGPPGRDTYLLGGPGSITLYNKPSIEWGRGQVAKVSLVWNFKKPFLTGYTIEGEEKLLPEEKLVLKLEELKNKLPTIKNPFKK